MDIVKKIRAGIKPKEYLIGNWLAKGELILLYASRGVGKTYTSLYMSHCLACGNDFLGYPTHRVRVVYFDGEMGLDALSRRLEKIDNNPTTKNGLVSDRYFTQCFDETNNNIMWNLSSYEGQEKYNNVIEDTKADVIFIDNLNTCSMRIDNKDNDFEIWNRIQEWAIKKRKEGKTVVFVHHAGKSGEQLGTSQRENIMDYIIKLERSTLEGKENFAKLNFIFTKTRDVGENEANNKFLEYCLNEETFELYFESLEEKKVKEVKRLNFNNRKVLEIADRVKLPVWKVQDIISSITDDWMQSDETFSNFNEDLF